MKGPMLWLKPGFVCAEIGVWKGDGAEKILGCHPSKLHLIDPWKFQDYPGRVYSIQQSELDQIYLDVIDKFKYNDSVEIHREFSQNISFPNEYFDWVYIDGNHSYETVMADLERYWPFIKTGGILCGDDYGWNDPKSSGGPKKAVHDFAKKMGLNFLIVPGDQFIFFKGVLKESFNALAQEHRRRINLVRSK